MRIRNQPAAAFAILVVVSAFLGLAPQQIPSYKHSDKFLHFITFFLLTACFYWILDINKRRNIQLTLIVCTLGLGIGSEIVQGILPNGRIFDIFDIFINILGSGLGVGVCLWYHKRMMDRKRRARRIAVMGDDNDLDVELAGQENGVSRPNLEQELDDWDENVQDWDENDATAAIEIEDGHEEELAPPVKLRSD